MDVDATVIQILHEMTRIPASLKSWRTPVIDLLNDNRLFNCNPADANRWRPIIKTLYDSDKTALPELLGSLLFLLTKIIYQAIGDRRIDQCPLRKYLHQPGV